MSFIVDLWGVPRIINYRDALVVAAQAACNPWRKTGPHHHHDDPLPNKRTRSMGIRKDENGHVHIRYHNTDVITWTPDHMIGRFYHSMSTVAVLNHFSPYGVNFFYQMSGGIIVFIDDVQYPIASDFTLADKKLTQHTPTWFRRSFINRGEGGKALKQTNYKEFCDWAEIMAPMLIGENHTWRERAGAQRELLTEREPLRNGFDDDLKQKELWPLMLRAQLSRWGGGPIEGMNSLKTRIRKEIYLTADNADKIERVEYFETLPRKARTSDYQIVTENPNA